MDELINVSETIKETRETLPETAQQTDGVLSTVVGFFNNVVFYPVKKANIIFKYKLEDFEKDLQEKTSKIPIENLQEPPLMIAGPTLEALRYTYDETELREMFENLLASAMDSQNNNRIHPAFVEIIKQLNSLDARILKEVYKNIQFPCGKIVFSINETHKQYSLGMPDYFVPGLINVADPFDVSSSLINLQRLGLIAIVDKQIEGKDYLKIAQHSYVQARFDFFKNMEGKKLTLNQQNMTVIINDYGKNFAKICLEDK